MANSEFLKQVRAKLTEVIQEMSSELGWRNCPHGIFGDDDDCDCTLDETSPIDGMQVLNGFVLISNWTTMEDGESTLSLHTAPDQLLSTTVGMLYMALQDNA